MRGWGFDVLELPVENPGDWDPRKVHDLLDEMGLKATVVAVMAPGRDLSTSDHAVVEETQEYLRKCVDAAAAVGSPVAAGPMYAPTGATPLLGSDERTERLDRVARALQPVLDDAGERGVSLAIEPLNRYETSLINTANRPSTCSTVSITRRAALRSTRSTSTSRSGISLPPSGRLDRPLPTFKHAAATVARPARDTSSGGRSRAR